MTTIADLLDADTRRLLLERLDELDDLARVMRQRGSLTAPAEPPPLHRAGNERTTSPTVA